MLCEVTLVNQRHGKRTFMVTLRREELKEIVFEPARIADAIEGWGTIYNIERVTIGRGKDFARLYVTTTDLNMTAQYLYKSILAEQGIIEAKFKEHEESGKKDDQA